MSNELVVVVGCGVAVVPFEDKSKTLVVLKKWLQKLQSDRDVTCRRDLCHTTHVSYLDTVYDFWSAEKGDGLTKVACCSLRESVFFL